MDAKIKNISVTYKVSLKDLEAYVKLAYDMDVTYMIKGDLAEPTGVNDISLVYWGIPGIGGFKITFDIELSGSISGMQSWHKEIGASVSRNDGFRLIREFTTKSFSLVAEAQLQLGLKAKLGVTDFPVLKAYVYVAAGCAGKVKIQVYDDAATPHRCTHFAAYVYVKCGLEASADCIIKKKVTLNYNIFNEDNSPVRISHHYEDGVLVAKCTRDADTNWYGTSLSAGGGSGGGGGGSYYTPGSSGYSSSGWSGGGSSTGYDDGNPVTIYTYTTDNDGNATITKYNGSASSLVIPSTIDGHTVTAIGMEAFKGNKRLQAVIIPNTVTEIGNRAFANCTGLTYARLPDGLTKIGGLTFNNCTGLTEVTIPKSLTDVYRDAYSSYGPFNGCENLSRVIFENGITKIPDYLLSGCTGKLEIEIPDTVTEIGKNAFASSGIISVKIPDTVMEIKGYAFYNCTGLTEVKLPAGLTTLGGMAFGNCIGLTEMTIPKSLNDVQLNSLSYGPFYGCENLKRVIFEYGITKVPDFLMNGCTGKYEAVLPDTVTEIGKYAFASSGIISVKIPDTVTEIKDYAFSNCTGLTEVKLPAGLTTLGGMAFGSCTGLTEITIPKRLTYAGQAAYTNLGPFAQCDNLKTVIFERGIIIIPAYLFSECTGQIETVLPDTVTDIDTGAFRNSGLCSIVLSENQKVIGTAAFSGCTQLKEIAFPDWLTTIYSNAFYGCSSLSAVTIPGSVTSIGHSVFRNCSSITAVKLPETLKSIPSYMFQGCASIEAITLPDSVTSIESTAFRGCTSLRDITWSKSLTTISDSAFADCTALTEITIPETVEIIGSSVFLDCTALTAVSIPDSVKDLGGSAFSGCDALTDVKLGTGITAIRTSTFNHCDALESLTVPRRVNVIQANAFKDCISFTSIFIPAGVTSIDASAFSYPDKLTIYGVSGTYAETFANENNIKFVAQEINAESAVLDKSEMRLLKGKSEQLHLTVTPENCTDDVTWKSANASVATVSDDGTVKAVGVGSTTIKVTVGSAAASCKVTVVQPVTGISLSRTSVSLEALETCLLTATVTPSSAEDKRVQWQSSSPDIASVSEDGLVTALKKGTAVITASSMDGSGVSRKCTVTVSSTAIICTDVSELESPHSYENSCTDSWLYTVPGATELNISFDERTCIEDEFDFLYIYDAAGSEIGKYTGTALAGKTVTVPGDTVKIKLVSDESGSEWGFRVISVTSDAAPSVTVTAVGSGDNKPACSVEGSTLIVKHALACRVVYPDGAGGYAVLAPTQTANGERRYDISALAAGTKLTVVVLGDITGDGTVNNMDAAMTYAAYNGKLKLTDTQLAAADVNGDGTVNNIDAAMIYAHYNGKLKGFTSI